MKTAVMVTILLLGTVFALPATAQDASVASASVAGTWEGKVSRSGRTADITIRLEQTGETVTGSYFTHGGSSAITTPVSLIGTFDGKTLSLTTRSVGFGYIKATVEGSQMMGTLVGRSGEPNTLTATRSGL